MNKYNLTSVIGLLFIFIMLICNLSFAQSFADTNSEVAIYSKNVLYQSDWTENSVIITNGSLLGFSDKGIIGKTVRQLSKDKKNGGSTFSHVAIAIVEYPSKILELIVSSIRNGGMSNANQTFIDAQINDILDSYPYLELKDEIIIVSNENENHEVFCLEVSGKRESVTRKIPPRVLIAPLKVIEDQYTGNMCVRTLKEEMPVEMLEKLIIENLGIGAFSESSGFVKQIFRIIKTARVKPVSEDSTTWFCSEFVTHVYQQCQMITQDIRAVYVIPRYYSSKNNIDVLANKAEAEQWLKVIHTPYKSKKTDKKRRKLEKIVVTLQ